MNVDGRSQADQQPKIRNSEFASIREGILYATVSTLFVASIGRNPIQIENPATQAVNPDYVSAVPGLTFDFLPDRQLGAEHDLNKAAELCTTIRVDLEPMLAYLNRSQLAEDQQEVLKQIGSNVSETVLVRLLTYQPPNRLQKDYRAHTNITEVVVQMIMTTAAAQELRSKLLDPKTGPRKAGLFLRQILGEENLVEVFAPNLTPVGLEKIEYLKDGEPLDPLALTDKAKAQLGAGIALLPTQKIDLYDDLPTKPTELPPGFSGESIRYLPRSGTIIDLGHTPPVTFQPTEFASGKNRLYKANNNMFYEPVSRSWLRYHENKWQAYQDNAWQDWNLEKGERKRRFL